MHEVVFTQALGLTHPWKVERIELDDKIKRLDLHVVYGDNTGKFPACGAEGQAVHDRRARTWRHLHFFQFEALIHCDVPRIGCTRCGATTQLPVPWARADSRFTLMFEALALTLARQMPAAACANLLGCSQGSLWRLIDFYVERARAQESHAEVRTLAIDETACRRGHHYITLVHDLDKGRLLFATLGRDGSAIDEAVKDLRATAASPRTSRSSAWTCPGPTSPQWVKPFPRPMRHSRRCAASKRPVSPASSARAGAGSRTFANGRAIRSTACTTCRARA